MAERRSLVPYLLGLLGVALYFAMRQKELIMFYGAKALDAANEAVFEWSLPRYAQPYYRIMLKVSKETGLDPFIIFAIGDRESNWGTQLRPPGPAGTGDWTPRNWTKTPMPPDGLGWGRGLMQIDYLYLPPGLNWADPLENVRAGAKRFVDSMNYFKAKPKTPYVAVTGKNASRRKVAARTDYPDVRPLQGEALIKASMAAYNTGTGNVLMSLAVGLSPDFTTTGEDYSDDVTRRMAQAGTKFVQNVA